MCTDSRNTRIMMEFWLIFPRNAISIHMNLQNSYTMQPFRKVVNCIEKEKGKLRRGSLSQMNCGNLKPEPLEQFHAQTVTQPNRGHPTPCKVI